MFHEIGFGEILVILVVALLLFGADRVPEIARSLGRSVNAFKKGLKDDIEDDKPLSKPEDPKKP